MEGGKKLYEWKIPLFVATYENKQQFGTESKRRYKAGKSPAFVAGRYEYSSVGY